MLGEDEASTGVSPAADDPAAARFRHVMAVFEKALAAEGAQRDRLLAQECGQDGGLRAEVEAMLGHAAAPAAGITAGGGMSPSIAGRIIGRASIEGASKALMPLLKGEYHIQGTLGHGGMGVVYRAEQSIPRRTVAIKAIRPGLTSRQVLRRFEHEAHILGRLQHPGIAQVFEAGAASSSRADEAFFVMEFVDGLSITEYSRNEKLSIDQRLEMLAKVCDAVQHAHQRRVIHRDLKPGNILVTKEGQPKILDFGVARLDSAGGDGESITRQTHAGQLIGTLAYMAPEQLEGVEVDARADVYALGVVLYQLLTGRLPHDFKGSSLLEAARLVRDEAPVRVASLDASLRGDIDIIVQKASERDRERRYQSASDLGADIRRHLRSEPIQARADSAVYVIRKQLSRHKGVTAAIVMSVLGLAAFAVYASVQSSREAAAKRQADANAERYRAELSVTNVERGRLLGMTRNFPVAEEIIWKEHAANPSDLSYWALWELYSRMPVRASLAGHVNPVVWVAASDAGNLAATGSGPDIHLWDTRTWEPWKPLPLIQPGGAVYAGGVRFTPDGSLMVVGDDAGQVSVWRVDESATSEPAARVSVCERVASIAVATAGPAPWPVCVFGSDGVVHLLKLSSDATLALDGELQAVPTVPVLDQTPIAINAARSLVVAGGADGSARAWRLDTRQLVWTSHEHTARVAGMAISPDGTLLVTGSVDRSALFWDISGTTITPSQRHVLSWDNGTVRSLEFSPDGTHIVAAGFWRLEVWDVAQRARDTAFTVGTEVSGSAAWVGGGSEILASGSGPLARVWEARPDGHLRRFDAHKDGVATIGLSPKGDLLISCGNDAVATFWDWPSMTRRGDLGATVGRVRSLAFSHDGTRFATAGGDGVIKVWDLETRECRLTVPVPGGEYYSLVFSADDQHMLTTRRDNAVRIYDAKTGTLEATLVGPRDVDGNIGAVYSNDGARVISAHGRSISVWDLGTPSEPPVNAKITSTGWSLCLLDEKRAAVGAWGGTIEVVNLESMSPIRSLVGHTQVVGCLTTGPELRDSKCSLVSSSGDGFIKLWDPSTGACLLTLNPGAGPIGKVIVSPDRRWMISAHSDGRFGVWDLAYYDPHIRAAAAFHESPHLPTP